MSGKEKTKSRLARKPSIKPRRGRAPSAGVVLSFEQFRKLAAGHTLVPVTATLTADLETPVSTFLRVAAAEPDSFLLESVEGGERLGRYTFIGVRPYRKVTARGRQLEVEEGGAIRKMEADVFEYLKEMLAEHTPAKVEGLPPFSAGAVGFFSYDAVRLIEKLPELAKDDLRMPDAYLMFFDEVLAFDHVKKEITLIVNADVRGGRLRQHFDSAIERLRKFEARLARPLPKTRPHPFAKAHAAKARTTKARYLAAVDTIKEYIAAGDVFQAVLSQRFDVRPRADAFSIYRALRIVNPSPYMYFLRFAVATAKRASRGSKSPADSPAYVLGSSPELLVRVHGSRLEYRPIAGTRPRAAAEAEDRAREAELLADEKERAEHVMLVDLGRNDVGRVSEFGSVKVKDLMTVERYSHVMHLVSSIEGTLRQELNPVDAFRACFPAGTLSGAPKVRAMEIIEELEPSRRGIYGGSVLYADFSGNLDSCIAIRSMYLTGGKGYVQAGAGIVADSIPENEFEECGNKAQAVLRAIAKAESAG